MVHSTSLYDKLILQVQITSSNDHIFWACLWIIIY